MFLILILLVSRFLLNSCQADCILPLPRFRFFAPLIFSPNGTLLETDNNNEHDLSITIPADINFVLSCAPNYFKKTELKKFKILSATCKASEIFEVNGEDFSWILDLGCEVRSVEEIVKSIAGCSDIGVEFGYENPIQKETIILGEACFSDIEGRTKFIHTTYLNSNNQRPNVFLKKEISNYLAQQHPDTKYKIDFLSASRIDELNERLQKLALGKVPFLEPRHYLDMMCLPNGQLYSILKLGWNFAVTNGFDHLPNYDLLMADIMNIQRDEFDLYLGSHSILSLKNEANRNVEIYLLPDEKKFPVPKYLWVAVAAQKLNKAAGFLISNNINLTEDEIKLGPCESKCGQISWLTNLLKNDAYRKAKNGYVWCCDIDGFQAEVPEMPKLSGKYSLL